MLKVVEERRVRLGLKDLQDSQEIEDLQGQEEQQVLKVLKVEAVQLEPKEPKELKGQVVRQEPKELQVPKVRQDPQRLHVMVTIGIHQRLVPKLVVTQRILNLSTNKFQVSTYMLINIYRYQTVKVVLATMVIVTLM